MAADESLADKPGDELLKRGWKQGSVFPAGSAPVIGINCNAQPPPTWTIEEGKALKATDLFVVATQVCDLKKGPEQEPRVELLRAFWTDNPKIIGFAGKNAVRYFLLARSQRDGKEVGLVAEAPVRAFAAKEALLKCEPQWPFDNNDDDTPRRFARWLAQRYDRPAIPTRVVEAVHRPVVTALSAPGCDANIVRILRAVHEILFSYDEGAQLAVEMVFMREEGLVVGENLSEEDAAVLAAWLSDVLDGEGSAELTGWQISESDSMTVRAYVSMTRLQLDQFSL